MIRSAGLYNASLAPAEQLKRISVKEYSAILTKSEHTEELRPTLFDILAYRANQFFSNAGLSGIEPLHEFNFNNQALFSSPEDFVRMDLVREGVDSHAQEIHTLKVYQQLVSFHLSQGNTAALIEADMDRLAYVHQKTTDERKDLWMYQALWDLYQEYKNHAAGQIPYVRALGLLKDQAGSKNPPRYPQVWTMKEIAAQLTDVKNKYARTEAASLAMDLLNVIYRSNIEITLEKELLPDQNAKIRVDYKNIPSLSFTVYQLPHTDKLNLERYPYKFSKISKYWKPVKHWKASLPQSEDLLDHSTEVLLEGLPSGAYLLVVNDRDISAQLDQNLIYQSFQVSQMAVIKGAGRKGRSDYYVLDRHNGSAMDNVQVKLFQWKYNEKSKEYELRPLDTYQNQNDGSFQMKKCRLPIY
ncbi:MAG: hypothetical protein KL787_07135 [Taibaiella sp.]|nr:hypothetical protein [Taibaiella sp.]